MKKKRGQLSAKERVKIFTWLLNCGKIKEAIWFISKRKVGGVLLLNNIEEKSDSFAKEALHSKHSEASDIDLKDMHYYKDCLDQ